VQLLDRGLCRALGDAAYDVRSAACLALARAPPVPLPGVSAAIARPLASILVWDAEPPSPPPPRAPPGGAAPRGGAAREPSGLSFLGLAAAVAADTAGGLGARLAKKLVGDLADFAARVLPAGQPAEPRAVRGRARPCAPGGVEARVSRARSLLEWVSYPIRARSLLEWVSYPIRARSLLEWVSYPIRARSPLEWVSYTVRWERLILNGCFSPHRSRRRGQVEKADVRAACLALLPRFYPAGDPEALGPTPPPPVLS
jgi:hypothetical protein